MFMYEIKNWVEYERNEKIELSFEKRVISCVLCDANCKTKALVVSVIAYGL